MSEIPDPDLALNSMQIRPETRIRMIQAILLRRGSSPICLPTFLWFEDCIHEKGDTRKRGCSE